MSNCSAAGSWCLGAHESTCKRVLLYIWYIAPLVLYGIPLSSRNLHWNKIVRQWLQECVAVHFDESIFLCSLFSCNFHLLWSLLCCQTIQQWLRACVVVHFEESAFLPKSLVRVCPRIIIVQPSSLHLTKRSESFWSLTSPKGRQPFMSNQASLFALASPFAESDDPYFPSWTKRSNRETSF